MNDPTAIPQFSDLPIVAAASARGPIICGLAKLPYAPKTGAHPAGWALPGGSRTADEDKARAIAEQMHAIMAANTPAKGQPL